MLSTDSVEDVAKLQRQYVLIKETCELSNIVLKKKKQDENPSEATRSRLKESAENIKEVKSFVTDKQVSLESVGNVEKIEKCVSSLIKSERKPIVLTFSKSSDNESSPMNAVNEALNKLSNRNKKRSCRSDN